MNTNTSDLPQDIEEINAKENMMMYAFMAFILGVIVGIGIGYLLFDQFRWHF